MKHIYFLLTFVLSLVLVSCGSNDDEILSPEVTRLAEEGYYPEMKTPTKLYYNELESFVWVKSDQRESFFKKLHDAGVYMYIIHPETAEDWTGYPFYDKVRHVLVGMNYKELEKMDEVVYAAPFVDTRDPKDLEFPNAFGLPDLRGCLTFQCFSSDEKKIVEQFAEENGLVAREESSESAVYNTNIAISNVYTVLYFSKNSKVFITDAVALLREKGIAATIPSHIYSHEGWNWYIP